MQQPIKLSVGYAYIMSGEALICTVEDGQPSHALTLTVQDLQALLAAFGENASPQAEPVVPESVRDAIGVICELAISEATRQNNLGKYNPHFKHIYEWLPIHTMRNPQPNPLPPYALTPEQWADMVHGYLHGAWSTPDREWLPPYALTPEQWAELDPKWICAAAYPTNAVTTGHILAVASAPAKILCEQTGLWHAPGGEWKDVRAITLPDDVDWTQTLTWRPGHEPQDGDV